MNKLQAQVILYVKDYIKSLLGDDEIVKEIGVYIESQLKGGREYWYLYFGYKNGDWSQLNLEQRASMRHSDMFIKKRWGVIMLGNLEPEKLEDNIPDLVTPEVKKFVKGVIERNYPQEEEENVEGGSFFQLRS